MNTWVKSFIVINLLLSALFSAYSMVLFANRQDYKAKFLENSKEMKEKVLILNEDIAKKAALIQKTQTDVESLQIELQQAISKRDEYSQELKSRVSEVSALKQDVEEKDARHDKLSDNYHKKSEELRDVQDQLEKAREIAQGARTLMIDLREQIVEYEKKRGEISSELAQVKSDKKGVEEKLEQKEWMIKRLYDKGINVAELIAGAAEPDQPIHAKVLSVRSDVNVVLLSVGKKDEVKEGYRFTVYRGDQYIGKVQVESVYPNYAAARIISELLQKDQMIREGDNASTRVY